MVGAAGHAEVGEHIGAPRVEQAQNNGEEGVEDHGRHQGQTGEGAFWWRQRQSLASRENAVGEHRPIGTVKSGLNRGCAGERCVGHAHQARAHTEVQCPPKTEELVARACGPSRDGPEVAHAAHDAEACNIVGWRSECNACVQKQAEQYAEFRRDGEEEADSTFPHDSH
eukprot:4060660-Pleurochrysis_carterae.AAC.2